MNTLFYPSNTEGKKVKEQLQNADIDFTIVHKEADSTVRLFTDNNSYTGSGEISNYIKSLKN